MYLAAVVPPEEEPMKRIQHTLTSAELLNLKATPIQLLPSPGPGKFYAVHSLFASFNHITTAYTLNGNTLIKTTTTETGPIAVALNYLITVAANRMSQLPPPGGAFSSAEYVATALSLTVDGPNELLDGDGTLLLILYYTIESTT
jgi:hypothetical protein